MKVACMWKKEHIQFCFVSRAVLEKVVDFRANFVPAVCP